MKPTRGENKTPPQGDAKLGEGTRKDPRRLSPAGERHKGVSHVAPCCNDHEPEILGSRRSIARSGPTPEIGPDR